MNLEKVAKRYSKVISKDYNFYTDLESSCCEFIVGGINKDRYKIAKLCILVIYGMLIRKSSLCAMIAVAPLLKLIDEQDIEDVLSDLEKDSK